MRYSIRNYGKSSYIFLLLGLLLFIGLHALVIGGSIYITYKLITNTRETLEFLAVVGLIALLLWNWYVALGVIAAVAVIGLVVKKWRSGRTG